MATSLTVHERMVAILGALPAIGKDTRNEQQGFMFRSHDDVLNALNPLLAKHGVFVVPEVLERVASQRTTSKGSVMFEVNLHVAFRFYGAGGDFVLASTWGEGTDMGDKATNKAMTMAFKNVLNQAFAISNKETVDSDRETAEESTGRSPATVPQAVGAVEQGQAPAPTPEPKFVAATKDEKDALVAVVEELQHAGHLTGEQLVNTIQKRYGLVGEFPAETLHRLTRIQTAELTASLTKWQESLFEQAKQEDAA